MMRRLAVFVACIIVTSLIALLVACGRDEKKEGKRVHFSEQNLRVGPASLGVRLDWSSELDDLKYDSWKTVVKNNSWSAAFGPANIDIKIEQGATIAARGGKFVKDRGHGFSDADLFDLFKAASQSPGASGIYGGLLTFMKTIVGDLDPDVYGVSKNTAEARGIAMSASLLEKNDFELRRTAMHEVGHLLGLSHCDGDTSGLTIMNTHSCLNLQKATLKFSDGAMKILDKTGGSLAAPQESEYSEGNTCCLKEGQGVVQGAKFVPLDEQATIQGLKFELGTEEARDIIELRRGEPLVLRAKLVNVGSTTVGVTPFLEAGYGSVLYIVGREGESASSIFQPVFEREVRNYIQTLRPGASMERNVAIWCGADGYAFKEAGRYTLRGMFYGLRGGNGQGVVASNTIEIRVTAGAGAEVLGTKEGAQFLFLGGPESLSAVTPALRKMSDENAPLAAYAELALGNYLLREVPQAAATEGRRIDPVMALQYFKRASSRRSQLPNFFRALVDWGRFRSVALLVHSKKDIPRLMPIVLDLGRDAARDSLQLQFLNAAKERLSELKERF